MIAMKLLKEIIIMKATYTTNEGKDIEIEFDDLQYQLLEKIDCYDSVWECRGTDSEGNIYSGIAEISCDECVGIEDIEFVELNPETAKRMYALYKAEVNAGIYDPKNPTETLTEKMAKAKLLK